MPGSSPLTRGKRPARIEAFSRRRLIPAHAGKTRPGGGAARGCAAHPRSRGENVQPATSEQVDAGSSPLTRGKPERAMYMPAKPGLIPAHAGKTGRRRDSRPQPRAHPRSRGENAIPSRGDGGRRGSSPLTRGKPGPICPKRSCRRLIPAHAGKTTPARCASEGPGAHPRSRGENLSGLRRRLSGNGSSPLTRGKLFGVLPVGEEGRLIPAHAGKTVVEVYEKL